MFSNLSQGSPIFVLDSSNGLRYMAGQIESITAPRPKYPTYTAGVSYGMNMETVVDIVARVDGSKQEFKNIPSMASVANFEQNKVFISDSKEGMISQVDALLQNSQKVLDSVETHKKIITDCDKVLKQLNPNFAKEADRDNAISALTDRVNKMQTEFGDIKGEIGQILSILTKKEDSKI